MNSQSKRVIAAGGVVWRPSTSGAVEVVGIYRPSCDNWSLPKGKLRPGEHHLAGACREVEEETGLDPIPEAFLTTATYELPHPDGAVTKTVDYWSMRCRDPYAGFQPNSEVTKREWFGLDEALDVLTRPRDQLALNTFQRLPEVTATVVVVRHANAGHAPDDATRQLDAVGRARAAELVPLLALYEPRCVVSASIHRCIATVTPLAVAMGLDIQADETFDFATHLDDPERAVTRLRQLAETGGAVVCSQAPVIADALALVTDLDDVRLPNVHTEPGGAWVLSFSKRTLVAVERL